MYCAVKVWEYTTENWNYLPDDFKFINRMQMETNIFLFFSCIFLNCSNEKMNTSIVCFLTRGFYFAITKYRPLACMRKMNCLYEKNVNQRCINKRHIHSICRHQVVVQYHFYSFFLRRRLTTCSFSVGSYVDILLGTHYSLIHSKNMFYNFNFLSVQI